ncbi:hypothetical protein ACS0PU_003984 [Formica fusca]
MQYKAHKGFKEEEKEEEEEVVKRMKAVRTAKGARGKRASVYWRKGTAPLLLTRRRRRRHHCRRPSPRKARQDYAAILNVGKYPAPKENLQSSEGSGMGGEVSRRYY